MKNINKIYRKQNYTYPNYKNSFYVFNSYFQNKKKVQRNNEKECLQ